MSGAKISTQEELYTYYLNLLDNHDWHFQKLEDHNLFNRGKAQRRYLVKIANSKGGRFQEAFNKKFKEIME